MDDREANRSLFIIDLGGSITPVHNSNTNQNKRKNNININWIYRSKNDS